MTADGAYERYDRGAQMWRIATWEAAYSLRHRYLGTGHFALALLTLPPGVDLLRPDHDEGPTHDDPGVVQFASPGHLILTQLGGDLDSMRRHAIAVLGGRERDMVPIGGIAKRVKRGPAATRHAQCVLTALPADSKLSAPITTAHILLALTDPKHPDPPIAGGRDRFGLRRNAVPGFYDIGQRLLDAFAPLEAIHEAARSAAEAADAAFVAGENASSGESAD